MKKPIIILDDDQSICATLDIALTYFDFEVKSLGPPEDILGLIESYNPDMLLVDYLLQTVNAVEWCHQIRYDTRTCDIPVVMKSAYTTNLTELDLDEFNAVLTKPLAWMNCSKLLIN